MQYKTVISVIVPIYNTDRYLNRCIDSILAQSYTDFEVLLIDDGSTDTSSRICDGYVAADSRVKVSHKKNGGSSSSRNLGIDQSHGDFVMFVDSDDWIEPDAIENLIKEQKRTDADIVSGNAVAHYVNHSELMKEPNYEDKNAMMRHMIELTIDHVFWKRIIRRSLFIDNNIRCVEGVNIGEDHHTLPRLIYYAKKCVTLDKVVYHYNCMNENSYMNTKTKQALIKRFYSDLASINILIDFFKEKDEICLSRLKDIKFDFLYPRIKSWYYDGDAENYDKGMRELYTMDNFYLFRADIYKFHQKFFRKTYFRYHNYNLLKFKLRSIGIIK